MNKDLGFAGRISSKLRAEVERQLLADFSYYSNKSHDDLSIDWSDACSEGHDTEYMGDWLENLSGVWVVNTLGEVVAWGWMDFIYGGGEHPLYVFWHYLCFGHPDKNAPDVVQSRGIPSHIWDYLPESTKDLCFASEYDTRWHNDPLVLQWLEQKLQR